MTTTQLPATTEQEEFFAPVDVPDGFKKAVGVVQVAMGQLGFLHRKIYNVLLANAYEGLGEKRTQFTISASTLAELAGFNSRDYQMVYDHCRELMQTEVLTVNFDNKAKGKRSKRKRGGTTLVSQFDVIEGGSITYEFSSKMAEILYDPEQYIWMTLSAQSRFDSKYELNLFENCIRYIGTGSTGFKDVEEWRGLLGAEEKTYDNFKDLNKKVIKPAVNGVSDKSGITVKPEFEREKRKIARIKFTVKENEQLSLLDYKDHARIRETEAYKSARECGVEDVTAVYWIETKGEQYVSEIVAYVLEKSPKNRGAYLASALKSGYGERTPAERKAEAKARELQESRAQERADREAAEQTKAELEARWIEHKFARFEAIIAERTDVELAEIGETILGAIKIPVERERWRKIGKDCRQIVAKKSSYKTLRGYAVKEVLLRWGNPEDQDLEAFRSLDVQAA